MMLGLNRSSGFTSRHALKPLVLSYMGSLPNSIFKFVVNNEFDWVEISESFLQTGFITKDKMVLMPEGQTQEELSKTRELVANLAIREGIRFTDRLHVTIWDRAVGV
jgi:organic radical activating enzyme